MELFQFQIMANIPMVHPFLYTLFSHSFHALSTLFPRSLHERDRPTATILTAACGRGSKPPAAIAIDRDFQAPKIVLNPPHFWFSFQNSPV